MSDSPEMDDFDLEDEDEAELRRWPNCATPDCEHKACLWGGLGLCHPCSVRLVGRVEMLRRYDATRAPDGAWNGELAP